MNLSRIVSSVRAYPSTIIYCESRSAYHYFDFISFWAGLGWDELGNESKREIDKRETKTSKSAMHNKQYYIYRQPAKRIR
jgi:hypothetical protein